MNPAAKIYWLLSSLFLLACAQAPLQPTSQSFLPTHLSTACLSEAQRAELLSLADPSRFPGAKYRKGPRDRHSPEKETDCSSFVFEIYRRAGLPYPYASTRDLSKSDFFQNIPAEEAKAGDLVLFRGHVGILSEDEQVISATRKRKRQPSSITKLPPDFFKGKRKYLRYICPEPQQFSQR